MGITSLVTVASDVALEKNRYRSDYDRILWATCRVQRLYREHKLMYRAFGPQMLWRHSGKPATYGGIKFVGEPAQASPYITVSSTSSPDLVARVMRLHWKLPNVEVLITVFGSAQDCDLSDQLTHVFERGLMDVVDTAKALIFTGGTDSGVMKLVANAMQKTGTSPPLVGIASWVRCCPPLHLARCARSLPIPRRRLPICRHPPACCHLRIAWQHR